MAVEAEIRLLLAGAKTQETSSSLLKIWRRDTRQLVQTLMEKLSVRWMSAAAGQSTRWTIRFSIDRFAPCLANTDRVGRVGKNCRQWASKWRQIAGSL